MNKPVIIDTTNFYLIIYHTLNNDQNFYFYVIPESSKA